MVPVPIKVRMREAKIDQVHIRVVLEKEVVLIRDQHVIWLYVAVHEAQFV